jgi:ERCC4-type nuclease
MMQLDSVLDDYDVKIMYSPHVGYTVSWLIAKSCDVPETEPPKEFPLRGWKPKGMSLNDRILFTLEGVVGHMTAKSILRKFRTLENVAKATMEQLMEVEGVGEKRAKLVYDVFHTEWQEVEDAQSPT